MLRHNRCGQNVLYVKFVRADPLLPFSPGFAGLARTSGLKDDSDVTFSEYEANLAARNVTCVSSDGKVEDGSRSCLEHLNWDKIMK